MQLKAFTAATLFGLFLLPLAHAQVSQSLQGNIPFNFRVGNTVLPAGEYAIRPLNNGSFVFLMRSLEHNGKAVMGLSYKVHESSNQSPKLVFHRYGDTYFLSQIWGGDEGAGSALLPSKAERVIAHEMATITRPHHEMELASIGFIRR